MRTFSVLILTILSGSSICAYGQFRPGDVGYNPQSADVFKKNKITTQTITVTMPGNAPMNYSVSAYDANGRLVATTYSADIFGEEAVGEVRDTYTYDAAGRIQRITHSSMEEFETETTFTYDDAGNLIADQTSGAFPTEDAYTFDANGLIKTRLGKEENPDYSSEWENAERMIPVDHSLYFWNASGKLVKEILYFDGDFYQQIEYAYDTNGNPARKITFYEEDASEPDVEILFNYNANGLLTHMESRSDGNVDIYEIKYSSK